MTKYVEKLKIYLLCIKYVEGVGNFRYTVYLKKKFMKAKGKK